MMVSVRQSDIHKRERKGSEGGRIITRIIQWKEEEEEEYDALLQIVVI